MNKPRGGQPGPRSIRVSQRPGQEPWEQEWNGHTWQDMPTRGGTDHKLLDFALYRRGLYDPELDLAVDEEDEEGQEGEKLEQRKRERRRRYVSNIFARRQTAAQKPKPRRERVVNPRSEEEKVERAGRLAALLQRYHQAKGKRGFVMAMLRADPTAHSAIARALGMSRPAKGPLRNVSLDRIERSFEKLNQEGWTV